MTWLLGRGAVLGNQLSQLVPQHCAFCFSSLPLHISLGGPRGIRGGGKDHRREDSLMYTSPIFGLSVL